MHLHPCCGLVLLMPARGHNFCNYQVLSVGATTDGTVDGVVFWFDLNMGENAAISTRPAYINAARQNSMSPKVSSRSHWRQCVSPQMAPIVIREGEQIPITVRHDDFSLTLAAGLANTAKDEAAADVPHLSCVSLFGRKQIALLNTGFYESLANCISVAGGNHSPTCKTAVVNISEGSISHACLPQRFTCARYIQVSTSSLALTELITSLQNRSTGCGPPVQTLPSDIHNLSVSTLRAFIDGCQSVVLLSDGYFVSLEDCSVWYSMFRTCLLITALTEKLQSIAEVDLQVLPKRARLSAALIRCDDMHRAWTPCPRPCGFDHEFLFEDVDPPWRNVNLSLYDFGFSSSSETLLDVDVVAGLRDGVYKTRLVPTGPFDAVVTWIELVFDENLTHSSEPDPEVRRCRHQAPRSAISVKLPPLTVYLSP